MAGLRAGPRAWMIAGLLTAAPGVVVRFGQGAQVGSQVLGGGQGVGVVFAEGPAAAVQGVLVKVAGGLHFTQGAQVGGQVM
jgi:hypothetical protein